MEACDSSLLFVLSVVSNILTYGRHLWLALQTPRLVFDTSP